MEQFRKHNYNAIQYNEPHAFLKSTSDVSRHSPGHICLGYVRSTTISTPKLAVATYESLIVLFFIKGFYWQFSLWSRRLCWQVRQNTAFNWYRSKTIFKVALRMRISLQLRSRVNIHTITLKLFIPHSVIFCKRSAFMLLITNPVFLSIFTKIIETVASRLFPQSN